MKEVRCFNVPIDMPTEYGSKIYKNDHPEIDAGSVMVLRHAGCLLFGRFTPEQSKQFAHTASQVRRLQQSLLSLSLVQLHATLIASITLQVVLLLDLLQQ
jgi:hypothetical protein